MPGSLNSMKRNLLALTACWSWQWILSLGMVAMVAPSRSRWLSGPRHGPSPPIVYEFAAELTFPVSEGSSAALLPGQSHGYTTLTKKEHALDGRNTKRRLESAPVPQGFPSTFAVIDKMSQNPGSRPDPAVSWF